MERVEGVRVGVERWGVGWRGGDRRWSGGWEVEEWDGGCVWINGMERVWGWNGGCCKGPPISHFQPPNTVLHQPSIPYVPPPFIPNHISFKFL